MQVLAIKDQRLVLDEDGFLTSPGDWTEAVGLALAEREGLDSLSKSQLEILAFLRQYYRKNSFFPVLRFVCMAIGQSRDCMMQAFKDPVTAWKIAGLPNPGEEVLGFGSWEPLGF